jgi:hypothetical protein
MKRTIVESKSLINSDKMNVQCVEDAFSAYSTFILGDKDLPDLQSPPDSAQIISLSAETTKDGFLETNLCLYDAIESSGDKCCLVTFHNKEAVNLPKSHVQIGIPCNTQNYDYLHIERLHKVVVELFLKTTSLSPYIEIIRHFAGIISSRGSRFIITIPTCLSHPLQNVLTLLNISTVEIPRPFRLPPSSSMMT